MLSSVDKKYPLTQKNLVPILFVILFVMIFPMVGMSSQKFEVFGLVSSPTIVNVSHDDGISHSEKIVASGNNVYLVWLNGTSTGGPPGTPPTINDVLFAKSQDGGNTFGTPIKISDNPGGDSLPPVIAFDGNNIYVSWIQSNFGNPSLNFARSTDGGITFSNPIQINQGISGPQEEYIAANGNHVYIVFTNSASAGVFFVRSADGGISFTVPQLMSSGSNNHDPKILANKGANIYLTWDDQNSGVYFRTSSDSGNTFGNPINISQGIQGGGTDIANNANYVYVTWYNFGVSNQILFARSTDNGNSFGSPITLSPNGLGGGDPKLAVSGNNVYLTWKQSRSGSPTYDIDAVTSSDNGNTFNNPVSLTGGTMESSSPQINATRNNVYVSWIGSPSGYADVFFSSSTDGVTYASPINISHDNDIQSQQLAASQNNIYLAWQTNNFGNGDIYVASQNSGISQPPPAGSAPTISITSPTNGAVLNAATVTIQGIAADSGPGLQKIEVSIDGGPFNLATGTYNWSYTTSLAGGTHTVVARATDNAANIGMTPSNSILTTIGGVLQGGSITFDSANGKIYVANIFNVFVIDGNTNTIIGTIPAGISPSQVAVDYSNGYLYVINDNIFARSVTVFDPVSNSPVTTITLSGTPEGIVFDPANGNLYVSRFDGTISVINGATNTVSTDISLGGVIPGSMVFDPSNGYIYVSSGDGSNNNLVSIIDGSTNTLVDSISFQTANIFGMVFDPLNNNIYVSLGNQTVDVVNDISNTIVSSIPTPGGGGGAMIYDFLNGGIYMCGIDGKVWLISDKTNSVITTIPVASLPNGIAFDSSNGNLYVSRVSDNDVAVIPSVFFLTTDVPSPLTLSPTASPPGPVNAGTQVTLNANPTGGGPGPITYQWSITSAPPGSTATILNPGSQNPTFTPDIAGAYQFSVTANAPTNSPPVVGPMSVFLSVNPDIPPTPNTVLTMSSNATTVTQGQRINFTYFEQNTGNVPITGPSITDSSCAHPPVNHFKPFTTHNEGDANNNGIIDPGETFVYQCVNIQNSTGTITHTATGTGFDPSGNIITAPAYPSEQTSLSVTVNPPTVTTGAGTVTFSTNNGYFISATSIGQSSIQAPDGTYPYGFFSWSINVPPNTCTQIELSFPNPIPAGSQWIKVIGGIPVTVPITISGNTITMNICDNQAGDANPTLGIISDPSGLALSTDGRASGGGSIEKNTDFTFAVRSDSDAKHATKGTLDYEDKSAKIKLHSNGISFLSVNPTMIGATFVGKGELDKHKGDVNILASITDPDKKGERDTFTITITDSTGKILYNNSGTVKGHIEIHKFSNHDDKSDSGINHNTDKK